MSQPNIALVKPSSKVEASLDDRVTLEKSLIESIKPEVNITTISKDIWYIDNVLSEEECYHLCKCVDESDSLSFWNPNGPNMETKQFRNVDTLEVTSDVIADTIWKRIENIDFEREIVISESMSSHPFESEHEHEHEYEYECEYELGSTGVWIAQGLNRKMLFAKYPYGGSFAPHTDGNVIYSFNDRSFFSVIIYLNSVAQGGQTIFYKRDAIHNLILSSSMISDGSDDSSTSSRWTVDHKYFLTKVDPKAGRMLVFRQNLVHEGSPPLNFNTKYIIRSDVMFSRKNRICDSVVDREAYQLYQRGEELAEEGNIQISISYFKRAFIMSPELKRMLRN